MKSFPFVKPDGRSTFLIGGDFQIYEAFMSRQHIYSGHELMPNLLIPIGRFHKELLNLANFTDVVK